MTTYNTTGVCPKTLDFEIVDGKVKNVSFKGGCNGNLQGISRLVDGLEVKDVIEKLKGVKCGMKSTSCPDQLAKALEEQVKLK